MKEIYRSIVRVISDYLENDSICRQHDFEMDGSGECGHFINEHHDQNLKERISKLFEKYKVDLGDFSSWLRECTEKVFEKDPVNYWNDKLNVSFSLNDLFHKEILEIQYPTKEESRTYNLYTDDCLHENYSW